MKTLLTLIFIFSNAITLNAAELDGISLITPTSYVRASSTSQTFKSKFKVGVGDLISTDVVAQVKTRIAPYKGDLAGYFAKPGELDTFIDKILINGRNSIIGNELTDARLIKFYEYLGTNLIGGFANKILEVEGVTDPARRALWVNKLTAPFKTCVASAKNALYDANHCLDALSASLVQSAGIGIVYELTRQNLSSTLPLNQQQKFNEDQANLYKTCLRLTPGTGSAAIVKQCALNSMKSGVLKITEPKLGKSIDGSASSAAAAKTIKAAVWPAFNGCTQKVGNNPAIKTELSDQFMNCIDSLVNDTGAQLVVDKIQNNPTLKSNFNKAEISKLGLEKAENFKACLAEQKKKNKRVEGMLDTDPCENSITNEITYKVVLKMLTDTAKESFTVDGDIKKSTADGKKFLDACWNNNQSPKEREACLRKTILSFSQSVAKIKLGAAIPDDVANKEALMSASLKELNSCLEKNLPANISEANNLSAKTSLCSNRLTMNVAQKVAQESIRLKAREQKMSEAETNQLIKTFVDQKFMTCIGTAPSDAQLDTCSGALKKGAAVVMATAQIKSNAAGKMSLPETDKLVSSLVTQKFAGCLGDNPSDAKLDKCIGDLTKSATKAIVLSYEKKQIKDQLNADFTPLELKPVEDAFVACTDKAYPDNQVSAAMDECTKNFALEFARTLGDLKLNSLLKSMLGTQGFNEQKKSINSILGAYNECLNNLKTTKMNDGLLDKITICTDGLEQRGINFISSTVNTWMTTAEKDAATVMIKNEFAKFVPCLGGLLPASPYSPKLQSEVESVLKPVALLLANYIEYSPENAKRTLDEITHKLSTDLKDVASNPESRKELIETLYNNGALDQFLKSMVRSEVKVALESVSENELPKDLRALLITKENFDKIFSTPEGQSIKSLVMDKILKPVLMEQASLSSPLMVAGMDSIKDKVVKMLVSSPNFGDQIIKTSVQNQINDMGGFTKFFAKALYGKGSLNWENVRTTGKGISAENYIRENILLPKFRGQKLSSAEENKINEEAEKLVKAAVKSYE